MVSTECNAETMEEITENLIQKMIDTSIKIFGYKTPPKKIHTPWWTTELNTVRKKVVRLRCLTQKKLFPKQALKREENYLRRLTERSKKKHYTKTLDKASGSSDIWKCVRWARGNRKTATPPIKYKDKIHIHTKDKCEVFREELYQPKQPLHCQFEIPDIDDRNNVIQDEPISFTELEQIFKQLPNDTAPGKSKLPYSLLKWV
jgi:hypothetical protein